MPDVTFATSLSLPAVASTYCKALTGHHSDIYHISEWAYLDLRNNLILAVAHERVVVVLATHGNPRPAQLLDRHKRLMEMRVLGDEECPEMQREPLRAQDMG